MNIKRGFLKAISLCLVIALIMCAGVVTAFAESIPEFDDSSVMTESLLLIDADSGEVMYSKNSDVKRTMASTVKIMTAVVALENIENPQSHMIEISQQAIDSIDLSEASTAGFEYHVGETFSALDVIYGLMLPSGCECSQILAFEVGESEEDFVSMMNDKATALGCENTLFVESHGLSDENYSTAEDMAKIASYAMENELFRTIVSTEYYEIEGFSAPIFNTNGLICEETNTGYYYKYTTGIKTGFTTLSGRCLVSSAQKGDDEYICVALGGTYSADDGYINHAIVDSASLFEWVFDNYTENVEVDITRDFASVKKNDKITLWANAYDGAVMTWSSSDESIATVDNNGVVTGKTLGRVKITATTQTGNFDAVYVSVGFENGIDVTSRYGDYTTGVKEPIDWKNVKDSGFDFAVIRAGWGSEDYPYQNDAEFVRNVHGAYDNDIPFYLSFIAYAQSEEEAYAEADYFLREMEEYFPSECEDGLKDVIYNMTYSPFSSNSKELNTSVALAFAGKLKEKGYNTLIFANKSVYKNLDVEMLGENDVGTYYSYYPYITDFSQEITLPNGTNPDMWQFRSDAYYTFASENGYAKFCISYMDVNDRYDVDRDGKVAVMDATLIQRYIVQLVSIDGFEIYGDADGDSKITVMDATAIQQYLVLGQN